MAAIRTRSLDGHPKCGVTSLPTLCLVNRVIAVADEVCGFFGGRSHPRSNVHLWCLLAVVVARSIRKDRRPQNRKTKTMQLPPPNSSGPTVDEQRSNVRDDTASGVEVSRSTGGRLVLSMYSVFCNSVVQSHMSLPPALFSEMWGRYARPKDAAQREQMCKSAGNVGRHRGTTHCIHLLST